MTNKNDNTTNSTGKSFPKPDAKKLLPPDPDGINDDRADWADSALNTFHQITNTDAEDILCDLLADLMHWADRHSYDFEAELERGRGNYKAEIEFVPIVIEVKGGCVTDVFNIPEGYTYQVIDHDQPEEESASTDGGSKC